MRWASQNSGILSARRGVGGPVANWVRDFGMLDSSGFEGRRHLAIAFLRIDFGHLDVIQFRPTLLHGAGHFFAVALGSAFGKPAVYQNPLGCISHFRSPLLSMIGDMDSRRVRVRRRHKNRADNFRRRLILIAGIFVGQTHPEHRPHGLGNWRRL